LASYFVIAQVRINYQGEHRNYGDQDKIKEHVKSHLKDVPHPEEISEEDELYYLFSIHDTNQDVGDTDAMIEDNERLEPRESRFAAGSEFDI
ncbi:34410_t:CDS:2, partial [Racocetra persica]